MMKHLRGGVKKGAFDEATMQKKFDAWKADKVKGVEAVRESEAKAKKEAAAKELEAEKKINEAIAKKVADKKAAAAAAKAEAEAAQRQRLKVQRLPLKLPQRLNLPHSKVKRKTKPCFRSSKARLYFFPIPVDIQHSCHIC